MIAQLSDPHMRLGPDDEGSGEALAAAVRAVLRLERRPDALIVTGDLADGGLPDEYARVRELLSPLPMPDKSRMMWSVTPYTEPLNDIAVVIFGCGL